MIGLLSELSPGASLGSGSDREKGYGQGYVADYLA